MYPVLVMVIVTVPRGTLISKNPSLSVEVKRVPPSRYSIFTVAAGSGFPVTQSSTFPVIVTTLSPVGTGGGYHRSYRLRSTGNHKERKDEKRDREEKHPSKHASTLLFESSLPPFLKLVKIPPGLTFSLLLKVIFAIFPPILKKSLRDTFRARISFPSLRFA